MLKMAEAVIDKSKSNEIIVSYETLYEMLRKEKQRAEIQKVDDNFFKNVIGYLNEKKAEIAKTSNQVDLVSAANKAKTKSQIQNIVSILTEFYNRRERKILLMAMNRSRTGSNIVDLSNLMPQERELLNQLSCDLDRYRRGLLYSLLEGKMPEIPKDCPNIMNGPVNAISGTPTKTVSPNLGSGDSSGKVESKPAEPAKSESASSAAPSAPSESASAAESKPAASAGASEPAQTEGTKTVKFTNAVPKFVGKELEVYGPFEPEDTANLPADIADLLIRKGRAEEI